MIYSKEIGDKAVEMYVTGESTAKIKRELGIESAAHIHRFVGDRGITRVVMERERRHLDEEEKKVLKMFDAGSEPTDIAREASVCLGTVYDWLKKHGRKSRRKGSIDGTNAAGMKIYSWCSEAERERVDE